MSLPLFPTDCFFESLTLSFCFPVFLNTINCSQVIIPYRGDPYEVQRLKVCGDLGQILFVPIDVRNQESLMKAVKYSNWAINLIGRDWETKNFTFHNIHCDGKIRGNKQ